jgi:Zn finger protein HypA/HybF involved in hydrogenase expression
VGIAHLNMSRTPIFDNAADSLEHGVAYYVVRNETPTAIKYAILSIYHSVELFLKELLAQVNPILIYRDIDRPITAESVTVGLREILTRLNNLGLALSQGHVKTLVELQRRRNRIEHHRFDPDTDHDAAVGQALKLLFEFLPLHLNTSLEDLLEDTATYDAVRQAILTYEERVEYACKEAEEEGQHTTYCPECGELTLAIESSRGNYCFLCKQECELEKCEGCDQYFSPSEHSVGLCEVCEDRAYRQF